MVRGVKRFQIFLDFSGFFHILFTIMEKEEKKAKGTYYLVLGLAVAAAIAAIVILFPLFLSDIYYQWGMTASEQGDGIKAEKMFSTALFWDDDNSEIYLALGDVYMKASHIEMKEFRRTHKRAKVIRSEAPVLIENTKGTEVFEKPVQVKELSAKDVRINIKKREKPKTSRKEEVVYSFPAYPGSRHGYEKKAVEAFLKGIKLNPYDARLFHGYARMMQFAAPVQRTEEVFNKAAALDPNNPNIHFSFGLFYLWKGKNSKGVLEMAKTVAIYPFKAREAYTVWRNNGGRLDELKAIAGSSPTALWELGAYYEKEGYSGRSMDAFLTACQVIGGNADYRFPNELPPERLLPKLLKKLNAYGYTEESRYFQKLWGITPED
jgi:tetratricopeptide (TPR) repeat protein